MKITAWIQHPIMRKYTRKVFASRFGDGFTVGFFGLSVHIGKGDWKFDWQGRDSKRFGRYLEK